MRDGYFKIHLAATILIVAVLLIVNVFLIPNEKKFDEQINQKNNSIAQLFDNQTGTYSDLPEIEKLQSDINSIKNSAVLFKWLRLITFSLLLITLTGWLATWLQWIFTKVKFTSGYNNAVLASALIVSGLIVMLVYYLTFT